MRLARARSAGPEAVLGFASDAGAFLAALFIGGLATDAANVGQTAYADVNDLAGLAACLMLFWRRRAPRTVAALTIGIAAVVPLAGGAALLSVFTLAARFAGRVALAAAGLAAVSGAVTIALFPDEETPRWVSALIGPDQSQAMRDLRPMSPERARS